MYEKELDAVKQALHEAARLCHSVQDRQAMIKGDKSPVTIADFGSQALVCRTLREAFPDDPIIAEEDSTLLRAEEQTDLRNTLGMHLDAVRHGTLLEAALKWIDYGNAEHYSDRFWTLDPIDGTKGFLRGGQYAVALALIEGGKVVVGGLACPNMSDDVFLVAKGLGATHGQHRIQVTEISDVSEARICQSVESGHTALGDIQKVARDLGITSDRVQLDSQAKYAVVASGDADIYMRLPLGNGYVERIWDHAAGALLLSEAGGKVTDCKGNVLDFSRGKRLEHNIGIIATNGIVHDQVVEAVNTLNIHHRDHI